MCGARRAAKAAPRDERGPRGGASCTHARAHQSCAPYLGAAGVCASPRSSIDTLGAGLMAIFLLFFFEALKVHAPVESVLRPTGRCQEGRRGCGAGMPARVTVVSTTQLAVAPRTCALDATHRRLIIGPAPLPLLLRRAPKVFASVFALAGC